LKGQILILCSNALVFFNTVAVEARLDSPIIGKDGAILEASME
jgi:hypothetical protein